jgi:hypothetical protein
MANLAKSVSDNLGGTISASDTSGSSGPRRQNRKPPPPFIYSWKAEELASAATCGTGTNWTCAPKKNTCEEVYTPTITGTTSANGIMKLNQTSVGGTGSKPQGKETQRGTRTKRATGATKDLGYRCAAPARPQAPVPSAPQAPGAAPDQPVEAEPVVITVTREDFASLPVAALPAHAGPAGGWLPVNMDVVLYAEDTQAQELETELLDTPVTIRATPVSYQWDLGNGDTITTDEPGSPWPAKDVTTTYLHEGWYDITLTVTFEGQFSVDGGDWEDIDGTIDVASDPTELYVRSLESRLTDPENTTIDTDQTDPIPDRSPDTEGPTNPHPTHTTI